MPPDPLFKPLQFDTLKRKASSYIRCQQEQLIVQIKVLRLLRSNCSHLSGIRSWTLLDPKSVRSVVPISVISFFITMERHHFFKICVSCIRRGR